jgi:hypothetical protein
VTPATAGARSAAGSGSGGRRRASPPPAPPAARRGPSAGALHGTDRVVGHVGLLDPSERDAGDPEAGRRPEGQPLGPATTRSPRQPRRPDGRRRDPVRQRSVVQDRQVEPAEALGVGEDVDGHDPPAPDREAHDREQPSTRATTTPAAPFTSAGRANRASQANASARSATAGAPRASLDAPAAAAAPGVDGPIRPAANITIDPFDDGARSRVTFALDFEGHGIGKPLVPAVRRQALKVAPTSYRNLKERLERRVAGPADPVPRASRLGIDPGELDFLRRPECRPLAALLRLG